MKIKEKKHTDVFKTLQPKELGAIKDNGNEKLLKYEEILDELYNERIGEIYNISKQIDFSDLTYRLKSEELPPINFISLKGPMHI